MALPDRTLCWVEGPPWDRTCTPVTEVAPESLTDLDALRQRLHELDNTEMGRVLAVSIGVLVDRGIEPVGFFLRLAEEIKQDAELLSNIKALGAMKRTEN